MKLVLVAAAAATVTLLKSDHVINLDFRLVQFLKADLMRFPMISKYTRMQSFRSLKLMDFGLKTKVWCQLMADLADGCTLSCTINVQSHRVNRGLPQQMREWMGVSFMVTSYQKFRSNKTQSNWNWFHSLTAPLMWLTSLTDLSHFSSDFCGEKNKK